MPFVCSQGGHRLQRKGIWRVFLGEGSGAEEQGLAQGASRLVKLSSASEWARVGHGTSTPLLTKTENWINNKSYTFNGIRELRKQGSMD